MSYGGENSTAGIYMITNQNNGHRYVGQSVDIHKRWMDHKTPSKRNKGLVLGRAFCKHGVKAFSFSILEACRPEELNERECFYIKTLAPEYNMNDGGAGNSGHRLTEEAKLNLSVKSRLAWQRHPEHIKTKILAQLTGPPVGHPVTQAARKKISAAAKAQFAFGMPEATKEKIRQAHKGKKKTTSPRKSQLSRLTLYQEKS